MQLPQQVKADDSVPVRLERMFKYDSLLIEADLARYF